MGFVLSKDSISKNAHFPAVEGLGLNILSGHVGMGSSPGYAHLQV